MDLNRKTAYCTLLEIEKNHAYSNLELNRQIRENRPPEPAFVRELVYGVLENRLLLDYILDKLAAKGIKSVDVKALILLRMGLYQIIYMDSVPEYAAVGETVKLAKKIVSGRDGFINGMLRGYGRKKNEIRLPDPETDAAAYLSVRYSYAPWIVKLWISQYGRETAEELLAAGNRRPPLTVRVNTLKTDRSSLAEALRACGFETEASERCDRVLYVRGSGLLDTEEYAKGLFSVQDEASVYAALSLEPAPGETVLDICAAPGGKSLAMAEIMENKGCIRSFDIYRHKLNLLEKEGDRLGISIVHPEENDGTKLRADLIESADRVLVDGPCSGLGVIRRKPEIKYREIEDDGRNLAEKQLQILKNSAEYVKKGGRLLYSTCTVNEIENTQVTERFLEQNRDFILLSKQQLLPHMDGTDGFFVCSMKRKD